MVQSANQCPCNHEQHASDLQRPKNTILITSCPYISTNIDPPPSQLQSVSNPPTRKIVKHALGHSSGTTGRDLVPGRNADRAQERPRLSVGQEGDASAPAQGSALRQRLRVRCELSGARPRPGSLGEAREAECKTR